MPWSTTRGAGTNAKYRSKEHRGTLARYKGDLRAHGYVICAAERCLFDSRVITNPNGREPDGLTAGHMPDGVTYNGPEHRKCNLHEASVRANRLSRGLDQPQRWEF